MNEQRGGDADEMLMRLEAALWLMGKGIAAGCGDGESIAGAMMLAAEYAQDIRARLDEERAAAMRVLRKARWRARERA